ncbi:hypothetical protein K503DRAFT_64564 [Rhizopogon vinicolor AM-OR11-026]|uniref:Uncharacterized protein n=1 Tax=Rhizopogon vinicolor AM-OR11-026 TaxID=1314800 RepID=A0A1B7MGA4_9AGAM|nr:hypothetical protein K503DRAFT_64564 [Rhizopogon vinicolor AM-OR11-026]
MNTKSTRSLNHHAAVLSYSFRDSTRAYSGCLDNGMREHVHSSLLPNMALIFCIGLISRHKSDVSGRTCQRSRSTLLWTRHQSVVLKPVVIF